MNCPNCGSSNIRKKNIIYNEGTITSRGHNRGSQNLTTQTKLARVCCPPKQSLHNVWFIVLCISGVSVLSYFLFKETNILSLSLIVFIVLGLLSSFIWSVLLGKKEKLLFKEKYKNWEESWFCLSCGKST